MQRARATTVVGMSAALILVGACASSQPGTVDFAVRRFQDADRSAVFDAAEAALADLGYRIEQRDEAAGVLTTRHILDVPGKKPARHSARISSENWTRRAAKVRVSQETDTISVYCRVVVEEQTTEAHRLFAADRSAVDTPTETPIEREAATTRRQNAVWRMVRRDKAGERRILAAAAERINALTPTGADDGIP